MAFLERIRALFAGDNEAPLVEYPEEFERVEVPHLHVHTANLSPDTDELLVIITTTPALLSVLKQTPGPVQAVCEGARPVTFVPVEKRANPLLDPKLGWLIPVTETTRREIATTPDGPGAHEFSSLHLGLVLE